MEGASSVETGIFVLGMHRSGTSAVTRLVGLLGARTPPEEDLVQPSDRNPKGYWESESLVAFNERMLRAAGCDMRCPVRLAPAWEQDARLDALRREAPDAVRRVFPTSPWVWKDPRHCLALSFWRTALDVRPVVVLVNRNPLEIAASVGSARSELGKIYALALWERYLRQALAESAGLPVLVTAYEDVLSDPLSWCGQAQAFLESAGVAAHEPSPDEVSSFLDRELRHARSSRHDVLVDGDVSDPQRELYLALEGLAGAHTTFEAPVLGRETPTTEALLAERRRTVEARNEVSRALETERQSRWWRRARRYAVARARRAEALVRRRRERSSGEGGSPSQGR